MNVQKQLKRLDKLVSEGSFIKAFDQFFHDDIVTWSSDDDKTTSKKEKRELLGSFFQGVKNIDQSKFHDSIWDGDTSYSKFTFIFTMKKGNKLKWHEIIKRKWKDGLVVDEFYFKDSFSKLKKKIEGKQKSKTTKKKNKQDVSKSKPSSKAEASKSKVILPKNEDKNAPENTIAALKPSKKSPKRKKQVNTASEVIAKAESTPELKQDTTLPKAKTPEKSSENTKPTVKAQTRKVASRKASTSVEVKAKVAVPKTSARKVKKDPDLTIIEGIGPKIKELLGLDGVLSFSDLAASKVADLKSTLLTRGGTRYNANNPTTWPEQAALAAEGKWEELETLKLELKAGKRVS